MIDIYSLVVRISAAAIVAAPVAALATTTPTNVALVNPGFESPYIAFSGNNGQITGNIANGWSDNSTWSDSTVQYSQEFNNPHSGASCQKMAVASTGSGQAQLLQGVPVVAGSLYTASIWVRGDAGTQVIFLIQDGSSPYESYLDTYVTVTANWQQITIQGYIAVTTGANLNRRCQRVIRARDRVAHAEPRSHPDFVFRNPRRQFSGEHALESRL